MSSTAKRPEYYDKLSLKLSWNAIPDVDEYEVSSDGAPINTVSGLTIDVADQTTETSYSYTVVAKNEHGNSAPVTINCQDER